MADFLVVKTARFITNGAPMDMPAGRVISDDEFDIAKLEAGGVPMVAYVPGTMDPVLASWRAQAGRPNMEADLLALLITRGIIGGGTAVFEKTLRYSAPASGDFDWNFYVSQEWTLTAMKTSMVNGTTPAVTFEVRYGPDPSSAANGTAVVPGGTATTNKTTGDLVAGPFPNGVIPADSHVWLRLLSVTTLLDQPDSFGVTLIGTI